VIYIGNVKMTPLSTREAPYLFKDLNDAREFSRISGRVIWAGLVGSTDHMYSFRIYPGGRSEQWPKKRQNRMAPDGTQNQRLLGGS
jgi:hypothetical protein